MPLPPMRLDDAPPRRLVALAAGRPLTQVWHNEIGGLTYRIGDDTYVKWASHGTVLDLGAEAERMTWAVAFTPVPVVLDYGRDDDGEWLVTKAIDGTYAVADRWKREPRTAVVAIAEGLRAMHDALPVAECPFSWSAEDRIHHAHVLRDAGGLVGAPAHADFASLGLDTAMCRIGDLPPVDKLVVCHGDACAPNTLIDDDGRWTAHVDLGRLGVADRWADLAIGSWSLTWNYEGDWQRTFFDAYGIEPDHDRIEYYRLLGELAP